ncbi:efflux RND transporter periplasmic adaptor subunit [Candidatus Entotheonella palauensis]|uniref:efflux RND transporter periplasmic adaptor subunit n=1 Tax=Candidatus Entotheonella palauensis TaxID=93172 RepID=UPI000B7D00B0|nr:efflux RND transporter periplasmic adaptor subunit [Candidatus Entotheonella palauensis]
MEHGCTVRQWVIFVTVLTLVSPLVYAQQKRSGPPPAPVTTARVEEGAFTKPVRLTGTVEALASTTLASEVAGYVAELQVDEGDTIRQGQVLAQVRALPHRLAMQRAQAMARADRERLRELKAGTRREDLAVAKANLDKAKVTANMARKSHTRSVSLQQRKIVSDEEFDQAYERMEEGQAEVAVRQAVHDRARAGARKEEIAAAEARAAASRADAALAEDRLERTTIRAPFDGVITIKHTEVGAWVAVGDELFDLEMTHKVRVRVDIPEAYYNTIPLGSEVSMTFDSVPNANFVGKVTKKIPRARGRSRAFPVKVELDNPEGQLATGMLARVNLKTPNEGQKSVIVPRDALVPRGPKQILYRVQEKEGTPVAELIEVKPGRYFGEAVEVFGDLRAGDRVIVRGNERLRPGQPLVMDQFRTN